MATARRVSLVVVAVLALCSQAAAQSGAGERWAVVIGVEALDNPSIPRARYAVADAEAIYQVLVGPGAFKRDHVVLLTDRTERKPTLKNVTWALGTFLGRSVARDDSVVIYFAGHGGVEADTRGGEPDGLAKYLVLRDTDPDDLYASALPMDEFGTVFAKLDAERVLVFIDASYSGSAGGRTFAAKKSPRGTIDDLFLQRLTRMRGRAVITAARPREVAVALAELGHGIFTYALLEGLKGAADRNGDGIVTVQELYEYVEAQVTQKAREIGSSQHPVMKGELEGVLPVIRLRRR